MRIFRSSLILMLEYQTRMKCIIQSLGTFPFENERAYKTYKISFEEYIHSLGHLWNDCHFDDSNKCIAGIAICKLSNGLHHIH